MNALDKIREWLASYPGQDILSSFQVDYTDRIPHNSGLPAGLAEIGRQEDILGNAVVTSQYHFGLYCVFEQAPGEDTGAGTHAGWVPDFRAWVQEQSARGLAPVFGNYDTAHEKIQAGNGVLYAAESEGTAIYAVPLSVTFQKFFEVI